MTTASERLLYWAPRILCIVFIAFVSLFALDVFAEARSFWQLLTGLAIHLVPSFILVAALVVAWRWEWVGALGFTACAAGFLAIVRGPWWTKAVFVVPCLLTAWLFFVNWRRRQTVAH